MRSSKSRSRNKGNRNNAPRSMGNIINRVFDSSGPEGKVRGTPQQIIEKYNQLARDAQLSGDRVATENFQQHAEHYLRLLSEVQREQDEKREEQERLNRDRQVDRDRDRDRNPRQDREPAGNDTGHQYGDTGQHGETDQPGDAQPDVIISHDDEESGLVETPESRAPENDTPTKPKRPRRQKKPARDADAAQPAGDSHDIENGDAPKAAE